METRDKTNNESYGEVTEILNRQESNIDQLTTNVNQLTTNVNQLTTNMNQVNANLQIVMAELQTLCLSRITSDPKRQENSTVDAALVFMLDLFHKLHFGMRSKPRLLASIHGQNWQNGN
ncbi:hypothetical protein LWI28_005800 [Acer negundo]|uniref:Uncharacterized protein n=1 Tax=Acer negundo TaxID=4023 RepID=A0AAD5IP86_ACENE|nr:hypothetical protein LWI28_005800 [Acer negundo]